MRETHPFTVPCACRDNPLIHLNYAVFLYNTDSKLKDKSMAAHHLKMYNAALRNHKPVNPDPEVKKKKGGQGGGRGI